MSDRKQLALETIMQRHTKRIPSWTFHPMEHSVIERFAGANSGDYRKNPKEVYLAMQRAVGTCMIDQYIPLNPLTMGNKGYDEETERGVTTGAAQILLDDMEIDSPEAMIEHMERYIFPRMQKELLEFNEDIRVKEIIESERAVQRELGQDILKAPYGFTAFPCFAYNTYGYANYFMACALYPEVIEKHFSLAADVSILNNRAVARAFTEAGLPLYLRLDHDMADSRGTLVNIKWLDKHWFPHFARSLEPLLKTDIRMIWHCDGNLMEMVPRLLDVGLQGFQGFQYEDGMDYKKICQMKAKDGNSLLIIAGVSVTRTLPHGTPDDINKEIAWLVENGPATGLFLGCSSSITPGVPWENLKTLVDGLQYYRTHGRG